MIRSVQIRSVKIHTDVFVRSHGKQPSGRGGWMFLVMDGSCPQPVVAFTFSAPSGTLSEAKAWAKAHVVETWPDELATGHLYLEVAP